jgi:mono/diheme cytochrome c family protein
MKTEALKLLILTLLGVAALFAQPPAKGVDPTWVVPSKAAERQNPLRDKPEAAAGGKKIFERSCVTCHGNATHERKNKAPDLSQSAVQSESDGALFWRISNGNSRTAMPSFSSLPEGQRWQLVLYIRSLANDSADVEGRRAGGALTSAPVATSKGPE